MPGFRFAFVLVAVGIAMSMGRGYAGDQPSEGPVAEALETGVQTVEEDRREAANEDPIDRMFAPLDDTVNTINQDMNQQLDAENGVPSSTDDRQ